MTKLPLETYKMTEKPLKSNKWPKYPLNLYLQDQNDKKNLYNHSTCFPPPPKILNGTYKFSFVIKLLYFVVYLLKFKIW